jgi:hypothetical protein
VKRHNADNIEALALHLALGGKAAAYAREKGIPARTVHRWAADPQLRARVREIRGDATDQAVGLLCAASRFSVGTLINLAREGKSEGVRLAAARTVLTLLMELRQFHEEDARILNIEKELAALAAEKEEVGAEAFPRLPGKKIRRMPEAKA